MDLTEELAIETRAAQGAVADFGTVVVGVSYVEQPAVAIRHRHAAVPPSVTDEGHQEKPPG